MRVGIIRHWRIAHKHARAYRQHRYQWGGLARTFTPTAPALSPERSRLQFVPNFEDLCGHPGIDYIGRVHFPEFRLEPVQCCASANKHIKWQKPMATNLDTARRMIDIAYDAAHPTGRGKPKHRLRRSTQFLQRALSTAPGQDPQPMLREMVPVPAYYSRPAKEAGKRAAAR